MRDSRKLNVWEKALRFTLQIYEVINNFPPDERFGHTAQLRRAAASVPTNLAEGVVERAGRNLPGFMGIAAGSAKEVAYQLILARDLNYMQDEIYAELNQHINEGKKMLYTFIQKLTANCNKSQNQAINSQIRIESI